MRRIGILGGMGPEATVELMRRVIRAVPGARDDADHVPLIVDQNTQVPSRIAYLVEGRGADPGPVLRSMAERLVAVGAAALAMPCNTAHRWIGEVRAARVPVLDMVALSVAEAAARGAGRVAVLGSPALSLAGVFDGPMQAAGLTFGYHSDLELIRAVKREGATAAHRAALARLVAESVAGTGAGAIIVACTEYSLLVEPGEEGPAVIDGLDVLARAIVAFSAGGMSGEAV